MSTATNPIGPGTVNRTANLPRELDERLGKAVYETGAKSRGEIIRKAITAYLLSVGEKGLLLIVGCVLWIGVLLACANGITGTNDQPRRTARSSAPIVRPVRKEGC